MPSLLIVALIALPISARAQGAAADTTSHAAGWLVGTSEPRVNEPFHAWLTLPSSGKAGVKYRVTLRPSPDLAAWIATNDPNCTASARTDTLIADARSTIHICARAGAERSVRLVATLDEIGANGMVSASSVTGSESITIKAHREFEVPGWLTILFTTLAGFLSGMGMQMWQHRVDRDTKRQDQAEDARQKSENHVREIESRLVDALAPELTHNAELLRGVTGGGEPELLRVQYGLLVADPEGTGFAFLSAAAQPSLGRLHDLYRGIYAYNDIVNHYDQAAGDPTTSVDELKQLRQGAANAAQVLVAAFPPHVDGAAAAFAQIAKIRDSLP